MKEKKMTIKLKLTEEKGTVCFKKILRKTKQKGEKQFIEK
jgi:hypothetical protein